MKAFRLCLAAAACALSLASQAATPTHLYLLNNASDSLGGPALVSEGGTFGTSELGAVGYAFAANQGLELSNAISSSVYTIDFTYSLDDTNGYRKLVDFHSVTSDDGFYNLSNTLNFYPVASTSTTALAAGALARVTLTRDAAGVVTGYVNGVAQWSFADGSSLAVFDQPQQLAIFFHDDAHTSGGESSGGFVDYIRIYDTALSAAEVAALPSPVPEPGIWTLLLAGLMAVGHIAQRRR